RRMTNTSQLTFSSVPSPRPSRQERVALVAPEPVVLVLLRANKRMAGLTEVSRVMSSVRLAAADIPACETDPEIFVQTAGFASVARRARVRSELRQVTALRIVDPPPSFRDSALGHGHLLQNPIASGSRISSPEWLPRRS